MSEAEAIIAMAVPVILVLALWQLLEDFDDED